MNAKTLERIPHLAAVVFVVLVVAACTIHLRGDEDQVASALSTEPPSDPLATKLAVCRSVTYEQKDALSECRKAWAEKRRQFLGQEPPTSSNDAASKAGSSLFVSPKDETRLPSDHPPIPQAGKE